MASERIRLTISVTPEVHEVFSRMAASSGLSLGRCMGDWLESTADGAQYVVGEVENLKDMPRRLLQEISVRSKALSAAGLGVGQASWEQAAQEVLGGPVDARSAAAGLSGARKAPSSNTGLNLSGARRGPKS